MASDSRLPWIIFAVLVALIAVPLGLWRIGEARRPVLEEVRIVTAAGDDPVFRTGLRRVAPDVAVEIAAALRVRRPGSGSRWLAPVSRLEIDGEPVEHDETDRWPEEDRVLRVFWFTVEGAYLGGDLTAAEADKLLAMRTYLAPEMGRGLRADTVPEQHNDDQINLGDEVVPVAGGTIRLYARVEVAERAGAVAAEQAVTSRGTDRVDDEDYPEIRLSAAFPEPISPVLGELFRLPGFEPRPEEGRPADDVTVEARGMPFTELVRRRFVASSWTFASVALSGGLGLERDDLATIGRVAVDGGELRQTERPLRWGRDLAPGDLLADRDQLVVLLADDGDGVLGPADSVALCWRRPAAVTVLEQAIRDDATGLELLRRER